MRVFHLRSESYESFKGRTDQLPCKHSFPCQRLVVKKFLEIVANNLPVEQGYAGICFCGCDARTFSGLASRMFTELKTTESSHIYTTGIV